LKTYLVLKLKLASVDLIELVGGRGKKVDLDNPLLQWETS